MNQEGYLNVSTPKGYIFKNSEPYYGAKTYMVTMIG